MDQIREAASEEAVFRIEGRFDQPAAIRLRQRVMAEEKPKAILDFSHVENLDDAALPFLIVILTLLRRKGRGVALLGLRAHHVRVLQHFGIEVAGGGSVRVLASDEESLQD
jgi:anti-anti-sigma regulatory factor